MKLKEIERLRAFAVLIVMQHHWGFCHSVFSPYLTMGRHGVDLFFVISGFVVTLSLLRTLPETDPKAPFFSRFDSVKMALKSFYVRRLTRIVPLAVVCILLHGVGSAYFPDAYGSIEDWKTEAIGIFSGVYNYFAPATGHVQFGYFWSLTVEEHFYLFLPLMLVACRTRAQRALSCVVIIFLVVFVFRALSHPDGPIKEMLYYQLFASHLRFDSLMAGVLIALATDAKRTPPILPRWLLRYVLLPGAAFEVWAMSSVVPTNIMTQQGYVAEWVIGGILVAYASLDTGYVFEFPLIGRVLVYIGSRSYALYLIHFDTMKLEQQVPSRWPAYKALVEQGGDRAVWIHLGITFGFTLLVAEVLHRVVERPAQEWGRRRAKTVVDAYTRASAAEAGSPTLAGASG